MQRLSRATRPMALPNHACIQRRGLTTTQPLFAAAQRPPPPPQQRKTPSSPSPSASASEQAQRVARTHRAAAESDEAGSQRRKEAESEEYQARYKSAARRWVSSVVAMPILLVTSYYLFDRLALGHEKKELPWKITKPSSD